jgi:hypothetical protein
VFALLEHTVGEAVHWDLLIEQPEATGLATWRLAANPIRAAGPTPAERIADHRAVYLDYEGPLSDERGTVRRVDCGPAVIHSRSEQRWEVELFGAELRGRFELCRAHSGRVVSAKRGGLNAAPDRRYHLVDN